VLHAVWGEEGVYAHVSIVERATFHENRELLISKIPFLWKDKQRLRRQIPEK
jgi:hypothetical protein